MNDQIDSSRLLSEPSISTYEMGDLLAVTAFTVCCESNP